MKKIIPAILLYLAAVPAFSQKTNTRAGVWSDASAWSGQSIPTAADTVSLNFDITIDADAVCSAFYSNGHQVTVGPGIHFSIAGGNGAPHDSNLLKRFVILDSALAAPNDTLFTYDYDYDNLGRCTRIMVHDFDNNSTGYTYNYFSGTHTLISARKLVNQVYSDSVAEFFTYSADGIMIADSVVEFSGASPNIFTYTYQASGDSITSFINTGSGSPFLLAKYILIKDSSGNVRSETDSSFEYNGIQYQYKNNTNSAYTYDSAVCPFYKLYPIRPVGLSYELVAVDDVPFYLFLQPQNLRTQYSVTMPVFSSIGNANRVLDYVYNNQNLPTAVIYRNLRNRHTYRGFYFY